MDTRRARGTSWIGISGKRGASRESEAPLYGIGWMGFPTARSFVTPHGREFPVRKN